MKILIGYDGSAQADAMLKDLTRAGLPARAEAIILRMVTPWARYEAGTQDGSTAWPNPAAVSQYERMLNEYLGQARKSAEKAALVLEGFFPGWKVRFEATLDDAAQGILAKAEAWKPDLIAVASHGRSAVGRLLLGSVAEKVLHHARSNIRITRGGISGKGSPSRSPRSGAPVRLLVGMDGSKGSLEAVKAIAARKWPKGTLVRIVSVVDRRDFEGMLFGVGPDTPSQPLANRTSAWLSGKIKAAAAKLGKKGLITTTTMQIGDARHVLLNESKRWKASSVFLGSRGLTGAERFLLGSVSSSVAAHATCSVEIIPSGP